jgi:NhaP-type Na+/H+ or K+/H+ antiporter
MVNALLRRGLAGRLAQSGDFLFTYLWRHGWRRRSLAMVGALTAGLAVIGAAAMLLPATPQSQMLPAVSAATDKSDAASAEPVTFADRFAAEVRDLPPTVGVAASLSNDPLAVPLAALAVRLAESRDGLDGQAKPAISAEGIAVAPAEQPHPRSQTTGRRP